jgi:dipeptidyl aminopeptidase/acylaminoacyl peptidase
LSRGFDPNFKIKIMNAVMKGGACAIAGSHACGNHWGNPCSVEANVALFDTLVASPHIDPDRMGLFGGGLGGVLIWNSVLAGLNSKVKAVAVLQSVASIEATIREQKFKAPLLEGYGLPVDMPDDEAVEKTMQSDPLPKLDKLPIGTPLPKTAIYHGEVDENIPAESNAIPLEKALKKAGGKVELHIFPGVGHNVYFMGNTIEEYLEAFFADNL